MISASFESILEISSLLTNLAAVFRLVQLSLYRSYPFFSAFLVTSFILQTTVVAFGTKSHVFFYSYVVLEPVRNVIFILVVWELFSLIFRNYAGLRSLSGWVMGGAAAVAPIGFVLSVLFRGSVARSVYVRSVVLFERGIGLGLVIFILIVLFFISRYPITLPRNSVVLCMLYSVWFLGDAAILLSSSLTPKAYGMRLVNDGQAILETACYLGWALMLSTAGQSQETRVRHAISPEREESLISELNAMNQMVLRAGRSISHKPV